MNAGVFYFIIC